MTLGGLEPQYKQRNADSSSGQKRMEQQQCFSFPSFQLVQEKDKALLITSVAVCNTAVNALTALYCNGAVGVIGIPALFSMQVNWESNEQWASKVECRGDV